MSRKKVSPLKGKPSTLDAKQLSVRAYKAAKTRAKKREAVGKSERFLLVVPKKLLDNFEKVVENESYSSTGAGILEAMRQFIRQHKPNE